MVRISLERELQILKNLLVDMSKSVDEMISGALRAIENLDPDLANKVIRFEEQVDYYEHMVTLSAVEIIALQQPVAKDLRFIISAFDIARNLERLADQAVNIAERVPHLVEKKAPPLHQYETSILPMAKEALFMLESAINAFISEDVKKAYAVIKHDEIVDSYERENIRILRESMRNDPNFIDIGVEYIIVVQNLERIGDHACNIAEAVIFTVEGKIAKLERLEPVYIHEILTKEYSTFNLLLKHARLVSECLIRLPLALEAYFNKDKERLAEIAKHITEIEKEADKVKTNIRGHIPKGLLLPVEKFEIFMYLKEQDEVADSAEEIISWLTFKDVDVPEDLAQKLQKLLNQNLEPLSYIEELIQRATDFLITRSETSRNVAKELVRKIRSEEYLSENLATDIKREIFSRISDPLTLFYLIALVDMIADISAHAENAADLMRAMIAK
jgi:phosphate transport system regulatory protein PhoU